MRGAVIYAGSPSQDALADFLRDFARVPLAALPATDLEAFDAVVVPRSVDAEALWARRHQFGRFLHRGGVLVAFGEIWTNWLPGARWEPEAPEDVLSAPAVLPHPLVDGFGAEELWWHRGYERWCSHGHVVASAGVELVVTNARGAAWCYVDRVSARGTLLVASNLDLDTHLYHGSALARTLLERLRAWLEDEVARNAPLRARPSERVAYFYSGVHFQRGFLETELGRQLAVVPVAELAGFDLARYPALFVPRESDQATLEENAPRIDGYLRGGGTLVSFEEVSRPWLPGARWEQGHVDHALPLRDGKVPTAWYESPDVPEERAVLALARADHPLVRALPPLERPWHVHGFLRVPEDAERLVWDPATGRSALALWRHGEGRILAGTIDPDCHAGYGSEVPLPFLAAIVDWARAGAPSPAAAG